MASIRVTVDGVGEFTEREIVRINISYHWVEIETLPVSEHYVSKIEKYTAPIERVKISVNMDAEREQQKEVD